MVVTSEFEAGLIQSEVKLSDSNPREKFESKFDKNNANLSQIRIGFGGRIKFDPTFNLI